jgi:hypothetical protein
MHVTDLLGIARIREVVKAVVSKASRNTKKIDMDGESLCSKTRGRALYTAGINGA